jgi:hypothetical protein
VSKGFFVVAQNSNSVDYIEQAYALALSIKSSQKEVTGLTVMTNDPVPKKYQSVFDQIVPIPWSDLAYNPEWKIENRWKIFHATPYDETIVLDTDMLLLGDISDWWNYCSNFDLKFCNRVRNYKGEIFYKDPYHRLAFNENNLTNPYFALHYFKKTDPALIFYQALQFVSTNWKECYKIFTPKQYQDWLSMDLATAIAIEITGHYESVVDNVSPLEFVHMKTALQNWPSAHISWQDAVPFVLNSNGELVIGNIKQPRLVHYVEKNFLNKKIISKLQELADV